MIKKTQRKVFNYIMTSFTIIILSIIFIVNIVNVTQATKDSYMKIDLASNILKEINHPHMKEDIENKNIKESFMMYSDIIQSYMVVLENKNVIDIINLGGKSNLNEQLVRCSYEVLKRRSMYGMVDNFFYKVKRDGKMATILYIDNSKVNESLKRDIFVSLVWGILALIFSYIISKKLSRRVVAPIEDTFEKQKQFISDASHELKTPLSVIRANADMVKGDVNKKYIDYIQDEVTSMDTLINKLLTLTRMENTKEEDKKKSFDLSKAVLGGVLAFESLAYEHNVCIIENIQPGIVIKGNDMDIKQLLFILLDNAIKHSYENGIVVVNLSSSKKNIMLEVKNTGDPIPKEKEELVFERFYRIDESRNRDCNRYGLGLAIAKSIVEKFEGEIKVGREKEYTVFTVRMSR